MEYAIPIAVVAVFITLYFISRPKIKAMYFDAYDDATYIEQCEQYIKNLKLPKEGGKTQFKRYKSCVKRIMFSIKMRRYCGFFDKFTALEDEIKPILKQDFAELEDLPSINGEPRAVLLARFCLARSDYSFDFLQVDTLAKIYRLSAKYVYNPVLLDEKYKKLAKSKLFLSICALHAGYKMEFFANIHSEVTDALSQNMKDLLSAIKQASEYDFSRYYTPLEILDKFDVFSSADNGAKHNFLALVENLDEFMYTVRLEKYMKSASAGHLRVKRLSFMSRTFCIINHKKDLTMLATALTSNHFMNLYFAPKRNKSITKSLQFENTFEPIYKFHTVNFGISTVGGRLRIAPALPRQIERADLVFDVNGVKNDLHIVRGDEKQLHLGDTLISGVDQIKLGKTPLNITVTVPKD